MTDKLPKCITAVFDLGDEFEKMLATHVVSKGNRSRYIKRLIYDDLKGVRNQISTTMYEEEISDKNEIEAFF